MERSIKYFIVISILLLGTNCKQLKIETVTTTEAEAWRLTDSVIVIKKTNTIDLHIRSNDTLQTIYGFGTCFNELGWTSLLKLKADVRDSILQDLFAPDRGANFTICRMPVAANDFARKWYSYNETDGDFEMLNFSIDNDKETLIPFIKNAQKFNSSLKIWASPWSPPQWMKYNKHYAGKSCEISPMKCYNGLSPDREGQEGTNMFIQEDQYFKAYALYFKKFIQEYKKQGIDIFMVMPQNEFNSPQVFPSCTWTAGGLATFIGKYLGPEMDKIGVEVMFGTMERENDALVDSVLQDNDSKEHISGVGFQWAGKKALPSIHKRYPELTIYQTEQECGNGRNNWRAADHSWQLLKYNLENGTNAYMYWNTSLSEGGKSTWEWRQNSLISVDTINNTYRHNFEYYQLKHVSHFVKPGAKLLKYSGEFQNLLAFKNPDNSIILVFRNERPENRGIIVDIDDKFISIPLKADSYTTLNVK